MDGVVVRKRIYLEDLDGFGVVHHARYAVLLDNAVLDFWLDAGWTPDTATHLQVIRELSLTYHQPILGVGDVDVHLWIERAGTPVAYLRVLNDDLERTIADIAAIGYKDLELLDSMGNFGMPAARLRKLLDQHGLRAPSTHMSGNALNELDRHLDEAETLGHEYLIVASLPITIYHGMPIGQISFMRMDGPVERPYGSGEAGSKYQGQAEPTPSRCYLNFNKR